MSVFDNPQVYRKIRKRYCELLNWHPLHGGWERPVPMSEYEFEMRRRNSGESWWEWSEFDGELPRLAEMIDEIEFHDGMVIYNRPNREPVLEVIQTAKKLSEPCLRIAKYKTKSGKQTVVRQFHIPPGNQFDQRITKHRAEQAWESIQSGEGVSDSIRVHGVNWDALVKYTPYVPIRKVLVPNKVRETIQLVKEGFTLKEALTSTKISSATFWRRTGGIKELINNRLRWTHHPSHIPLSEWGISK